MFVTFGHYNRHVCKSVQYSREVVITVRVLSLLPNFPLVCAGRLIGKQCQTVEHAHMKSEGNGGITLHSSESGIIAAPYVRSFLWLVLMTATLRPAPTLPSRASLPRLSFLPSQRPTGTSVTVFGKRNYLPSLPISN